MADSISREQRSRNMSRIRGRDTAPEKRVRSILHRAGYRFSLHRKDLPGKPDIVLRKHRAVVFVHGCFWHQHSGCLRATMPKTNTEYWEKKLAGNAQRDSIHHVTLSLKGWRVIVVWECEIRDTEKLRKRMLSLLKL